MTHASNIVMFKGKTVFDAGLFYAPYIPLTVGATMPDYVLIQGRYREWTTFMVTNPTHVRDVLPWCKDNLGRRFIGFMDTIFGWRLSNWGRWVYEDRYEHEIGVMPYHAKVFLRRPEDIALFKLRWL